MTNNDNGAQHPLLIRLTTTIDHDHDLNPEFDNATCVHNLLRGGSVNLCV